MIPTPGHSPGSTCFLVHSPTGQRYLFTGDTLYRSADGSWKAGFIPGHNTAEDRQTMATSIAGLRDLQPDLVIGSAFAGSSGYQEWAMGNRRSIRMVRSGSCCTKAAPPHKEQFFLRTYKEGVSLR